MAVVLRKECRPAVTQEIRFGLVGCGTIARRHARILSSLPGAALAAVSDTDAARAAAFGKEFSVPHYAGDAAMCEKEKLDCAVIATPSGDHARAACAALARGLHVVVEKPMALTLEEADRMIAAADAARARLFVVKQNRLNRPVAALRRAVEAGRFGTMVMGTVRLRWCRTQDYYAAAAWRGTWAADGGVLANQAAHHIDLLQWMMGPVESVFAMTARRLVRIEAEDTGAALLRFASGALGIVEATVATRPADLEGSLSILGSGGAVEIGGFYANELRHWKFAAVLPEDAKVLAEEGTNPPDTHGYGHRAYLAHVVETIRSGGPSLVDGLEGRKSLEIIHAIYDSAESGKEVPLRLGGSRSRLGAGREATA